MRKMFGIALNSLRLMVRDPKALLMSLLMPLILVAILGTALKGLVSEAKVSPGTVLVVNEDVAAHAPSSPGMAQTGADQLPLIHFGKILVDDVLGNDEVRKVFATKIVADRTMAQADVSAGRATAVIYIPPTFSADALAGRAVAVQLVTDPGDLTRSVIVTRVVQGFTAQIKSQLLTARLSPTVSMPAVAPKLTEIASGNHPVSAMQYYAAAMTLMFMVMTALQRGGKLLEEREQGTLQRALVTPTGKSTIIAGQLLGSSLVALAQFAILAAGTRLIFGVRWGPWPGALLLGVTFSLAVSGIGTVAASLLKDQKATEIAAGAVSNLLGLLSGALFPLYSFPDALKLVAKFTPNYWALQGFLDHMSGAGAAPLWLPVTILVVIALVTGSVGSWRLTGQ
jgi:ABC-2 type transport system permease protein